MKIDHICFALAFIALSPLCIADATFEWDVDIKGIQHPTGFLSTNEIGYHSDSSKNYIGLIERATNFGTKHAATNIKIDQISPAGFSAATPGSLEYTYLGTKYYFSNEYLSYVKAIIADYTHRGFKNVAILTQQWGGNAELYYSSTQKSGDDGSICYAFQDSLRFRAILQLLADWFSDESNPSQSANGMIAGYIVGNEVNDPDSWNYMGPNAPVVDNVTNYAKVVRRAINIFQGANSRIRIFISLQNPWKAGTPRSGRDFLDSFVITSDGITSGGTMGAWNWDIAYHPYPQYLAAPWSDSAQEFALSLDANYISFKNLEVLYFYLGRSSMLKFDASIRRIILSEQAVEMPSSGTDEQKQTSQAAAYAYTWMRASRIPNIDAYYAFPGSDQVASAYSWGLTTNKVLLPGGGIDLTHSYKSRKMFTDAYANAGAGSWPIPYDASYRSIVGIANWNAINPYVAKIVTGTAKVANLSYRGNVTPSSPVIGGFVISGAPDSNKTVLLRAIGPTLGEYEISGFLPAPKITLRTGGTIVATNTGWGNSSSIFDASNAVGAFPLTQNSADSAIVTTLSPGVYTVTVESSTGSSGIALCEIYDNGGSASLANLSARGTVGTGSAVGVGSIVISGSGTKALLVRAVGPTLANYGVSSVLAQPRITIVDVWSGNVVLAINQGWENAMNSYDSSAYGSSLGAFALPAGNADSALFVRLYPGAYTVTVEGVASGTGDALFEIYDAGN